MWGRVILIGAALLAACGSGEPIAPAEPNRSEPVAAPPPPPVVAEYAIPPSFYGVYDVSREACAGSSDGRLTVAAMELRFHESIGAVRKVTAEGPDAVSVEADYQGEGESWRSVRKLRLSDGDSRLTVSGDGTSLTRIRCP